MGCAYRKHERRPESVTQCPLAGLTQWICFELDLRPAPGVLVKGYRLDLATGVGRSARTD